MQPQSIQIAFSLLFCAATALKVVAAPTASAPATQDADFTPPQVAVLSFDSRVPEGYFDLDTGTFLPNTPGTATVPTENLRKAGVDLATSSLLSSTQSRIGVDLVLDQVLPEDWNAPAAAIVARVGPRKPGQDGVVSGRVYFFKTCEGSLGVLRIASAETFGPVSVEFKRIQPVIAAKLLAALSKPDFSSPETLVKTYLNAIEIDDDAGMAACLHSNDPAPDWAEKYAAAQLAVHHFYLAARKAFGDQAVQQSLEPVQPHIDPTALAAAQWRTNGDRARPVDITSGPLASLELIRVKDGWKILLPPPPADGGVDAAQATATAARQMAGTLADGITFRRIYPDAAAMTRAYANSLQTAKSQLAALKARLQKEH